MAVVSSDLQLSDPLTEWSFRVHRQPALRSAFDEGGSSSSIRHPIAHEPSPQAGTIQFNSMECGGRAQRRPRFYFPRLRSHTPNGSSSPNRSTVLPLPTAEGWPALRSAFDEGGGEGERAVHQPIARELIYTTVHREEALNL